MKSSDTHTRTGLKPWMLYAIRETITSDVRVERVVLFGSRAKGSFREGSDIDLAVFECGYFDETPDGTRILTEVDGAIMSEELTHEEVMARVHRVDADRTVLTEIEHLYGRTYDDFRTLESADGYEGVEFAYDGLRVSV